MFDFNGVFVEPKEQKILKKICSIKGTGTWIAQSNYYVNLWKHQRGEMSPYDFWSRVFVDLTESQFKAYVEGEYEKPFVKNGEVFKLASELAKKYSIYLVSNSNFLQGKEARKQGLYKPFKDLFLSHEVNELKPFPKIFEEVVRRTHFKPNECLLIDDSTANVLSAIAQGFQAIVFHDAQKLKEQLSMNWKGKKNLLQIDKF